MDTHGGELKEEWKCARSSEKEKLNGELIRTKAQVKTLKDNMAEMVRVKEINEATNDFLIQLDRVITEINKATN